MKLSINPIITNKIINRFIILFFITGVNFLYIIIIFFISSYLFSQGLGGKYFILLIILFNLSTLPILGFFLNRIDSIINPTSYNYQYIKIVDSILNIQTFDEIIHKIFYFVVKDIKAGFGHITFYRNETDVFDIVYQNNRAREIKRREKTESDRIFLKNMKGPDDIIIKAKSNKLNEKETEIIKALESINTDIIVPIFYNNRIFGLIAIGRKRRITEREIRLLKLIAFKLAILSVNNYYFNEIRKRREVEKEYELTYKIQKQFLPKPSLESGKIIIKAYHNTASSLTREFYDIFVNNESPDDIRISAYRVYGDVKETSIFMPGIQAILQSYARLGFSPEKTLSKLKNLVKQRDVLNGDLMIFHSSIKQSGEFICCCSDYPAPFLYQHSLKKMKHLTIESELQCLKIKLEPGDIIIAACGYYFGILSSDIQKYSDIINQNHSLPLEEIKDKLLNALNKISSSTVRKVKKEDEDKLLILITMENAN